MCIHEGGREPLRRVGKSLDPISVSKDPSGYWSRKAPWLPKLIALISRRLLVGAEVEKSLTTVLCTFLQSVIALTLLDYEYCLK